MQQPPKRKFRKDRKGRNRGRVTQQVAFGEFGLKSVSWGRLNPRQIEAARRTITRCVKRDGKLWIRIFADKPISKKPLEVRQGKGKGSVEYYVFQTKPGAILFEIAGVERELAVKAFKLAAAKLPVKVTFVDKEKVYDE